MTKKATKQEVVNACEKLGFQDKSSKRGKHFKYAYYRGGIRRSTVIVAKGRGDLPTGTIDSIRDNMHLGKEDFGEAIACPFGSPEYANLIDRLIEEGRS